MPATIKCTCVGQNITRMKAAFDDSAIFIKNPSEIIDNKTWKSMEIFWTRRDAEAFCERHSFSKGLIAKVGSRWQRGYAIGLGRNYFAPDCAEARLIAHAMGCVVNSVEVSL